MNILDFFISVIILFLTSFYVKEQFVEVEYMKSKIDGRQYLVQNAENFSFNNLICQIGLPLTTSQL